MSGLSASTFTTTMLGGGASVGTHSEADAAGAQDFAASIDPQYSGRLAAIKNPMPKRTAPVSSKASRETIDLIRQDLLGSVCLF
jgi:hypothetical protein